MAIQIQHTKETGEVVAEFTDEKNIFYKINEEITVDRSKFPMFVQIDLYGDTIYNQLQIKPLICELRELNASIEDKDANYFLSELIKFAQTVEGKVHRYLKFVGD